MRFVVCCCLAALVAGCASTLPTPDLPLSPRAAAEAGATLPAPALSEDRLIAEDGAALPLRHWLPPGQPDAVILALHGFNDYSNAFALPGSAWARRGIATYAYDQRGFGAAPGRGRWPGARRLAGDAATAAALLHRRYPGTPLYLLGESMGGAVAILAASDHGGAPVPDIDGVILVAPAVWGRDTMSVVERAALWVADLLPAIRWSPSLLPVRIQPSDNLPMLRAMGADPLVIKDTRADAVNGLVDLMGAALAAAPDFRAPVLLLYGARDQVVPRPPVARFVAALPPQAAPHQRLAYYPGGYHMLLRDLEGPELIADIAAWIAAPTAPLPSGADREARTRLLGRVEPVTAALR